MNLSSKHYFLAGTLLFYAIIALINLQLAIEILNIFVALLRKIILPFVLVFLIMFLTNWLIKPEKIVKYLGKYAGTSGWIYSMLGGILSAGPIYMWFPLLKEMRNKGMREGFLVAFLYNRSIKLPLLPVFIYYFGLKFVIIISIVMIFASVIQGIAVEKIMELKNENSNSMPEKIS